MNRRSLLRSFLPAPPGNRSGRSQKYCREPASRELTGKPVRKCFDPGAAAGGKRSAHGRGGERTSEFISQSTREIIDDLGDRFTKQDSENHSEQGSIASAVRLVGTEIVCLPARDEADELVGMMFCQLLQQAGYAASYLPSEL